MKKKSFRDEYPTEPYGGVPSFKNVEEEAEFWDTHSFTDFPKYWSEDVEIVFDLKKRREETLVVRIQKDLKEKMKKIARGKGLDLSGLARMWLIEKLRTEVA